jgi:hypothetical protein
VKYLLALVAPLQGSAPVRNGAVTVTIQL